MKTIPEKKKFKKAKCLSEEALQIGKKKKRENPKAEEKGKVNAEFQRIARRDKKAFLNEQCKEVEENNRMRKTRDHQEY